MRQTAGVTVEHLTPARRETPACQPSAVSRRAPERRPMFIISPSRSAHRLLHSASGPRMPSSTSSCSSNALSCACRLWMLLRCAATLVEIDFSSFADSAPGSGMPATEGSAAVGGSGTPSLVRPSMYEVIRRS